MTIAEDRTQDDRLIEARVLRLNALAAAVGAAVLAGAGLLLGTLWLSVRGVASSEAALLEQILPGYGVSLIGGLVGGLYGCVIGAAAGYVMAVLYNRLAR